MIRSGKMATANVGLIRSPQATSSKILMTGIKWDVRGSMPASDFALLRIPGSRRVYDK
jgi:hypothetical protein